ncbi:MAG: ATP-binding protein [bacterium]|nr:ATP-binding protein [bacterium]
MLPFRLGMRVAGREFCGRRPELAQLREYMAGSGRVYVVGERRMGKTSLVFEAARTLPGTRVVDVDLMAARSLGDLTQRLAAAVVRTQSSQSGQSGQAGLLRLLKGLAQLRPTLGVDPLSGTPTVSFAPGSGNHPDSLEAVFALIAAWPRAVVVIDEFQDVLGLPDPGAALAQLRGLVQRQPEAAFVFCGSVRHRMEDIFNRDDSPFFKAAMRLHVGPIDRREFRDFLAAKFAESGRTVTPELLDTICDLCHDNPGDVQRFCTALWQVTSHGQAVTDHDLPAAWEMVFAMHAQEYEVILRNLSAQQSQALRGLAALGGRSRLTGELLAATGIALLPSLAKALSVLAGKGLVVKDGTEYRICDPFLIRWLVMRLS